MGPALPSRRRLRARSTIVIGASALVLVAGSTIAMSSAEADTVGCDVDYVITAEWPGGFNADVTVTNLGDTAYSWQVAWDFPAGQQIQQAWNAETDQSGPHATASNLDWNHTLAGDGSIGFGFNASFDEASGNTAPGGFTLNGVDCTGDTSQVPTDQPTDVPTEEPTDEPTDPSQDPWDPPDHLVQPLNEVWQHVEDTYNNGNPYAFRNYGWDQVMATGGSINYCVRWDSSQPVSATLRDQIETKVQQQYQLWFDQMVGWSDWPFDEIDVNVVGWAAYDRNLLQWNDDSVDIYIGDIREDAPQCAEDCGRFFHQDGNYPNCPGGYDSHYDQSLWLTEGMGGGAGGDWGQRMGSEYFVNSLGSGQVTIYLHEVGHTFGLDDFYDWTPTGQCCFIMKAGSSSTITEFDRWMLRDWWRHLKDRYNP